MAKISRSWDLPRDVLGADGIRTAKERTDIFMEADGLKVASSVRGNGSYCNLDGQCVTPQTVELRLIGRTRQVTSCHRSQSEKRVLAIEPGTTRAHPIANMGQRCPRPASNISRASSSFVAASTQVKDLRRQAQELKEVVAEQALDLRILKKSMIADGGDEE